MIGQESDETYQLDFTGSEGLRCRAAVRGAVAAAVGRSARHSGIEPRSEEGLPIDRERRSSIEIRDRRTPRPLL